MWALIIVLPVFSLPQAGFRQNLPTRSQLLQAPHVPTRASHWLLLGHCSGPLGSAIPLGQPLSKHLCLEDFKLGPLLCLERMMREYGPDQAALTQVQRDSHSLSSPPFSWHPS